MIVGVLDIHPPRQPPALGCRAFRKKAPMQKNRAKKLVEMAIIFLADVKFLTVGETE